jgi:hypothetical protein
MKKFTSKQLNFIRDSFYSFLPKEFPEEYFFKVKRLFGEFLEYYQEEFEKTDTVDIICASVYCTTILEDVPRDLVSYMKYCARCKETEDYSEMVTK